MDGPNFQSIGFLLSIHDRIDDYPDGISCGLGPTLTNMAPPNHPFTMNMCHMYGIDSLVITPDTSVTLLISS